MSLSGFLHQAKYVYWRKEASLEVVDQRKWSLIYRMLRDTGTRLNNKTLRSEIFSKNRTYYIEDKGRYRIMYCNIDGKLHRYSSHQFDDTKNLDEHIGSPNPVTLITERFRTKVPELGREALSKAFGHVPSLFKICVPKQFYYKQPWLNPNKIYKHVSSIDSSSHYPSCLTGKLPDANTSKVIQGYTKPSNEYPFAFYLKSGHVAEFGVFDSHDWINEFLAPNLLNAHTFMHDGLNEETVLMKASKYTLTEEIEYFYKKRKTDESAKFVMNACIGRFHMRNEISYSRYPYAHLAAICLGRSTAKQLKKVKEIGFDKILTVIVDGIQYQGKTGTSYSDAEKGLGKYSEDFVDAEIRIKGVNCYVAMKDGKVIKYRHGSYNATANGEPIENNPPQNFNDMDGWQRIDFLGYEDENN